MSISIRKATAIDSDKIMSLIVDLAVHQGHLEDVRAKGEDLHHWLSSSNPPFECFLAERRNQIVGFALFCHSFSTWEGHPGIYLDDLYVIPEERGNGVGKLLVGEIAQLARQRGCKRLEFISLVSNQSAYNFNQSLGAKPLHEFIRWQLKENDLIRLSQSEKINFTVQNQPDLSVHT